MVENPVPFIHIPHQPQKSDYSADDGLFIPQSVLYRSNIECSVGILDSIHGVALRSPVGRSPPGTVQTHFLWGRSGPTSLSGVRPRHCTNALPCGADPARHPVGRSPKNPPDIPPGAKKILGSPTRDRWEEGDFIAVGRDVSGLPSPD